MRGRQAMRVGIWLAAGLALAGCAVDRPAETGVASKPRAAVECPGADPAIKRVYWGDFHVHTAYSLDAYGYGTLQTPADAYRFGKGERVMLDVGPVQLERPLDFMAVTDHAEWLDLMFICSGPRSELYPACKDLKAKSTRTTGGEVFRDYVNPTITLDKPAQTQLCAENPQQCLDARDSQWARLQAQANEADEPCRFTAFIGFEWSATPNASHTHRNVIFASENVTPIAIDYIRYPKTSQLWDALARMCRPEDGCDAIAIPHNMNMGDGISFDIETEEESELALRMRYERLVEITQEKGASECLPPYGDRQTSRDCEFEAYITSKSRPKPLDDYKFEEWERMRATYARGLLRRGLLAQAKTGKNPLEVGFIGSTDAHTGLAGYVDEATWQGSVFGIGSFDRNMSRLGFNPGGVVGVWAEQNTRASLFAALKRREVYATSGPRIQLRVHASAGGQGLSCERPDAPGSRATPMGGRLPANRDAPTFRIEARADRTPLARIEIVKGATSRDGFKETVETVWRAGDGARSACLLWRDTGFDPGEGAYWYVRAIEAPSLRWSAVLCRREGRCAEFPGADRTVEERAWASPIWYAPA
jgi:hypothetical protein